MPTDGDSTPTLVELTQQTMLHYEENPDNPALIEEFRTLLAAVIPHATAAQAQVCTLLTMNKELLTTNTELNATIHQLCTRIDTLAARIDALCTRITVLTTTATPCPFCQGLIGGVACDV